MGPHVAEYPCQRPSSWPATLSAIQGTGLPVDGIEAIHLPSKLQETMIMATLMDRAHRLYVETYHLTTNSPIEPDRLDRALHTLATKHSTLRTILCQNRDQSSSAGVLMAVLDPEYVRHTARFTFGSESLDLHEKHCRVTFHVYGTTDKTAPTWSGDLPWKVSVSPVPGASRYRLTLSYHHALMDGTSARQLLQWIHQEVNHPGTVTEVSDYITAEAEMAAWRTPDVQVRLRQRYDFVQKASTSLKSSRHHRTGLAILSRQIPTVFEPRQDKPAVPAWIGRLALSLTLCAFENSREAVFHETMSARRFLSPENRQVMGPLLLTQPRLARFHGRVSLARVAQSLRSNNDIAHDFTAGELRSLVPALGRRLHVAFACQTDDSYPANAVEDWEWTERETCIDMPLLVELMPPKLGAFVVHLHYQRGRFSETTMRLFHHFLCDTLEWLQAIHSQLAGYDFHDALSVIRAQNGEVDGYLREIKASTEGSTLHAEISTERDGINFDDACDIVTEGKNQDRHFDLADIETVISHHHAVKACGVLKGVSSHGQPLLALVETYGLDPDWSQTVMEIRSQLAAALTPEMVPSHFIRVAEGLPQTDTGNVDWSTSSSGATSWVDKLSTPGSASPPGSCNELESEETWPDEQKEHLQYWVSQPSNSQPAAFLHDRHQPVELSGAISTQKISIEDAVYNDLQRFCKAAGVTPFAVLLACFRATNYRMTGAPDANIGAIFPGLASRENRGSAALPVCLRIQVDDEDSFEQLVQHVQTTVDSATHHRNGSSDAILEQLGRSSENPLYLMIFAMHRGAADRRHQGNSGSQTTKSSSATSDLELHIYEDDNSISGEIQFASDLFTTPTINSILSVFAGFLERGLEDPRRRIETMPLVHGHAALQRMGLLDVCHSDYPRGSSIVDLFENEVALNPESMAVVDASTQLTYAHLDRESEHVANWLRGLFLPHEAVVGVFAPRSCEAIVAIVGILKAGLAYVPMDHQWPDTRIEAILASIDSPRIVLHGAEVKLPSITVDGLNMVPVADAVLQGSRTMATSQRRPFPNSLAYIIFTSGSTGKPKGVMIEHQSVISRVRPSTNVCGAGTAHKSVAHMASLAFDAATWEIYSALLNGGTVVCIDTMTVLDYQKLGDVFIRHRVCVAFITPALLKECIATAPTTIAQLESLAVGGERCDPQVLRQARKLLGNGELIHVYGPTENTIYSTKYTVTADEPAVNGVPIGRAIMESGAYVMDLQQSLVPLGVLGELVVTGDGLARGYTDPKRTKDAFIIIEIGGQQIPAYRTGDRARYRPEDGQVEYFGRMDNQVKIRGNRLELGEVEHALLNQEGVDEAVVVVQKHEVNEDQQLVAFVTGSHVQGDSAQLRRNLQGQLPSYMVPAVITVLERMPMNHNGKVDRRALTQMKIEQKHVSSEGAPRNEIENVICQEFSRVLGCSVGISDNFYSLGGHSLMGTRAVFQIAQRLECPLSMPDLIEAPTPDSLAQRVSCIRTGPGMHVSESPQPSHRPSLHLEGWEAAAHALELDLADVELTMPCTPFQEGVLSADMALGERSGYRATMCLSFNGDLDLTALRSAWQAIVSKEQMLRTVFLPVVQASSKQGIAGNSFFQAVLKEECDEVRRVCTIGGLDGPKDKPDLHLGMGRVPVCLAVVPGTSLAAPEFVMSIHHALYDGAYLDAIVTRLTQAYHRAKGAANVGDSTQDDVPFSSFVRNLQRSNPLEISSFWKSYLQGAPCVSWPMSVTPDAANRGQQPPQEETVSWKGDICELARRNHTTPAVLGRAALALVVAAHSDTNDVVLGEVSTGRYQDGFVAGPCIATHPVRLRLTNGMSGDTPLPLDAVVKAAADSYARTIPYQQYGLAGIRRESDFPGQLPFQILYVYQNSVQSSSGSTEKSGLSPYFTCRRGDPGRVDFPLVVEALCVEPTGHMQFHCTFDPLILPPEDAHWVMQHLGQALQAMETRTKAESLSGYSSLQLIGPEENKLLERMGRNPAVRKEDESPTSILCAHDIIHNQALKSPEKIALQYEQTEFITYRQLDEWSTGLSYAIRTVLADHEPVHGQRLVPICFDKSINMVVAILAVLKAGAAYVPLDADHPISRITAICRAINSRIIIWDGASDGHPKLHAVAQQTNSSLWAMDDLRQIADKRTHQLEPARVSPDALAYVLFTSGSTGTPKGVMVEHRNLVSFMEANAGSTDCSWTSNRLALLAYTFDASVGDVFGTLGKGGRLSLVQHSRLMPNLATWLGDLAISHLALTPTIGTFLLNGVRDQALHLPHLKTLVFGGEPFRREILDQVPPEMTVWNGYGPTEAAIEVTACLLQERKSPSRRLRGVPFLSLGAPIHHNRIHLLRPNTVEPVPIGAVGELCITGPQVSRGYLTHPDVTAKHFVPDPFGSSDRRMYRTGDLARWHGDGSLEYLGRMDGQIKLRGLRIEPADIATAAQSHPAVKACVVTKVQGLDATEALVAIAQVDADALSQQSVTAAHIQAAIAGRVPEYMVPAQVQLQTDPLPQTSSGKLDHRAVAQLAEQEYHRWLEAAVSSVSSTEGNTRARPNSLEARIAHHWAAVLGIDEDTLDITTPFARLGGDSLRAISLLAVLRCDGLPLTMADLRQSATIQTQAAQLRAGHSPPPTGTASPPPHLHLYNRTDSIATVVLVHPFLGQSKSLEALVPFLDARFNAILIDDPFFGTPQCPGSLTKWARRYTDDLIAHVLDAPHRVILGGYSFGGLIALEMALQWEERRPGSVASLVLLDPGTYAPTELDGASEAERAATAQAALSLLGVEARDMARFQDHYERHNAVLQGTRPPPVYAGRCLYVALPERVDDGIADWWKRQCPALTMECVACEDHYALLRAPVVGCVGEVVNRHCCESVG